MGKRFFRDAHGDEADVIGVGGDGEAAATVERDVEFAGETVEVAVVDDVVMQRLGVGADVEQFVGGEAAIGRGGDVADVVGAGTT